MKINTKLNDGVWVDYNKTVSFKIKAFSLNNIMLLDEDFKDPSSIGRKINNFCLINWKGFEDENGNKFEYNDDNKTYILNYYTEFNAFISSEIDKLKNLKTHPVKRTLKK